MSKKRGQAALAEEFGVSRQAISKLVARGMPLDPDLAREWRQRELNPAKAAPDPGPSPTTLVARVHRLVGMVDAAQAAGRLDLVLPELRTALLAVPTPHRGLVQLPDGLWRALIGAHALAVLNDGPRADGTATAADHEEVGAVVYALACGEAYIR